MHAYVIRPEHHGPPLDAITPDVVDVPELRPDEVLVHVITAGVNFNGVCAHSASRHPPGNMALMVQASRRGLKTLAETG